ncbi:Protein CBG16880 [Caenorhabditis briggsae]|uniref:Protein CBG16880 n=1 Tax=Caenorhabditis briggsae TaxID=6238 RepID=A8XPZ9_CAEBR|nr:Protein CBG16880 [Caenorhabditis briggsae]CAP34725.1 Protein CBG16880 [Caenorhabditis briggsae]
MSNEYEQYIVASYNRDEKTSVIELIHNSILSLFGNESTEIANKWKSGEAFEKLDLLRIELHSLNFSQGDAIGAKYIDETKRALTHTLPKICNWNNNQITNSITSHIYVVRKTDKHVASVLIREKTFSFGVWDKTEEEFLRMAG